MSTRPSRIARAAKAIATAADASPQVKVTLAPRVPSSIALCPAGALATDSEKRNGLATPAPSRIISSR